MSKKNKEQTDKPVNVYLVDGLSKIPLWFKCQFVKYWCGCLAFFLTFMTINLDFLDQIVILLLLFTLVTEYLSNLVIRQMALIDKKANYYLPHLTNSKSVLSILFTFIYCLIITGLSLTVLIYWGNLGLPTIGIIISESYLDPFSFGILYLLFDYIYRQVRLVFKKMKERKNNETTKQNN
jgi:hypothetical protein